MILATHVRPLPARPIPLPGESLTSLLPGLPKSWSTGAFVKSWTS